MLPATGSGFGRCGSLRGAEFMQLDGGRGASRLGADDPGVQEELYAVSVKVPHRPVHRDLELAPGAKFVLAGEEDAAAADVHHPPMPANRVFFCPERFIGQHLLDREAPGGAPLQPVRLIRLPFLNRHPNLLWMGGFRHSMRRTFSRG